MNGYWICFVNFQIVFHLASGLPGPGMQKEILDYYIVL